MTHPRPAWIAAVCASALGVAAAAAGQTPAPPADPPRLVFGDTVVVTAERGDAPQSWIAAATVAVEGASLAALPAQTVGELLSFVPGFRVQQAALHAGRPVVSARGFFGGGEAEYVVLLVDGVRVADAESGLVDWSTVVGSSVSRIEAARGPGASLYGDAAVGGVVQLLTDSTASRDVVSISGGSFGTVSLDGTWRWRRTAASGFVSGAGRRTDGTSEHSRSSELTFASAVTGAARGLTWRWTANALGRDQEDPGVITLDQRRRGVTLDPVFRFDNRARRTLASALSVKGGSTGWRHQARVSVSTRDEDGIRTILLAPGLGDSQHRHLATDGAAGAYEAEHAIGSMLHSAVRVGVEVERQGLNTSYRGVRNGAPIAIVGGRVDGARVRAGAFASTSWMPAASVRVSGGLRWDRISDGDLDAVSTPTDAWSPRAGLVFQPAWMSGTSLFAQYSRAFKAPTLDQKFDPRPYPDFRGGSFTISNGSLQAQHATNIEGGVSGGARVRWSLLAYRMHVRNEIDFDARTFSYANIGRSRHHGIEADVRVEGGTSIRPVASYALSAVAATDAGGGLQLKNVPRHQVMVGTFARLPLEVDAFLSLRRAWGAFLDDDNTLPIASSVIVDLRVRRRIKRVEVFADVLNGLDRRFDEFGFVLADFRGGRVGYVYPGQPRALRAGVTIGGS